MLYLLVKKKHSPQEKGEQCRWKTNEKRLPGEASNDMEET